MLRRIVKRLGGRQLALLILPSLLLLSVLELGARLLGARGPNPQSPYRFWFKPVHPRAHTESSAEGSLWVIDPPLTTVKIPVEKKPGDLRIFSFGGSSTFGFGVESSEAFPARLAEYLRAAHPDRRVVSANFALCGRDSYDMADLAEYSLRFDPDVWILYAGHNDLINYRSRPALHGFLKRHDWLWGAFFFLEDHSRLASGVSRRLDDAADSDLGSGDWARFDAYQERIIRQLISNYERILSNARAHGVRVIVVLPASNLFDQPPMESGDESARLAALEREALAALERGRSTEAIAAFQSALARAPKSARVHYELGHAFDAIGDSASMYRELTLARDLDQQLWRATSKMQEAQREFAVRNELTVIDAPEAFAAASPNRRVGCNLFRNSVRCDWLHPNALGHDLIARELARRIP